MGGMGGRRGYRVGERPECEGPLWVCLLPAQRHPHIHVQHAPHLLALEGEVGVAGGEVEGEVPLLGGLAEGAGEGSGGLHAHAAVAGVEVAEPRPSPRTQQPVLGAHLPNPHPELQVEAESNLGRVIRRQQASARARRLDALQPPKDR